MTPAQARVGLKTKLQNLWHLMNIGPRNTILDQTIQLVTRTRDLLYDNNMGKQEIDHYEKTLATMLELSSNRLTIEILKRRNSILEEDLRKLLPEGGHDA